MFNLDMEVCSTVLFEDIVFDEKEVISLVD